MEETLVILKPDAVKRRLTGEIISRFEKKNLSIKKMKMEQMTREKAEEHYAYIKERDFFDDMITYMTDSPAVFLILKGEKAVAVVRKMIGKTSPFEADPGTIRGDYAFDSFQNLVHASDSCEAAAAEIQRFFETDQIN